MSFDQHRNPDGTYNGLAVMAEVTGLPRRAVDEVYEQVKANSEMLRTCPRHDFSPILPLRALGQRYRCIECGGEVDSSAHHWYQVGLRMGRA